MKAKDIRVIILSKAEKDEALWLCESSGYDTDERSVAFAGFVLKLARIQAAEDASKVQGHFDDIAGIILNSRITIEP